MNPSSAQGTDTSVLGVWNYLVNINQYIWINQLTHKINQSINKPIISPKNGLISFGSLKQTRRYMKFSKYELTNEVSNQHINQSNNQWTNGMNLLLCRVCPGGTTGCRRSTTRSRRLGWSRGRSLSSRRTMTSTPSGSMSGKGSIFTLIQGFSLENICWRINSSMDADKIRGT